MKQTIEDAFLADLACITKYRNPGEVIWEDKWGNDITIKFPTNSLEYAVVKHYYGNGNVWWEIKYRNGRENGKAYGWNKDGTKLAILEYLNGEFVDGRWF